MVREKKWIFCLVLVLSVNLSGCAAITALRHPGKKDMRLLSHGTGRDSIIAYFGPPVSSEKEGERTVDIYQFVQGYSGGNKATRAVFHITADFFTLFIWEIIGWPAEAAVFDGDKMTIKVTYDENKQVEDFVFLRQGD